MVINDIPSSCRGEVCTFNYTDAETPRVDAVYPPEGQGGTSITIYGGGFATMVSDIDVTIGNSRCHVTSSNDTVIECTASDHTAGWYNVRVEVEGKGMAVVNESICFRYLLSVESISPDSGGVGGGEIITVTGNGFMRFENHNKTEFGDDISRLPWFQYGIGLPYFRRIQYLNLCLSVERELLRRGNLLDEFTPDSLIEAMEDIDSFTMKYLNQSETMEEDDFELVEDGRFRVSSFHAHLENIYFRFPAYVSIGGIPCIITESTFTELKCVPVLNLPQLANLSVVVLTERVLLEDAFEIDLNQTVYVHNIEPLEGAVTGNTVLTITGYGFNIDTANDVTVYVGMETCDVYTANDTTIVCFTPPSGPSLKPVYVLTPDGVAVWQAALMEELEQDDIDSMEGSSSGSGDLDRLMNDTQQSRDLPPFPVFTYKLEVFVDLATPFRGSAFGGTRITLYGGIFVMGYTQVTVGGRAAEIVSMNETEVTIFTPTSTRTHYIGLNHSQLNGRLSVYN